MDWFAIEILTGLQKLACCSWERTPAAEVLPGTAQIWIEALTHGRAWDQGRDASRIRAAFLTLAQTRTQWPGPLHFLQALPDSTQLRLAGAGERPADSPELRQALDAVARGEVPKVTSVDGLRRELGAVSHAVTREDREAAERELAAMRDRKSQAAGADA